MLSTIDCGLSETRELSVLEDTVLEPKFLEEKKLRLPDWVPLMISHDSLFVSFPYAADSSSYPQSILFFGLRSISSYPS